MLSIPNSLSKQQLQKRQKQLKHQQSLWIYQSPPTIPGIAFAKGPVDNLPDQMPTLHWRLIAAWKGALTDCNFSPWNPKALFRSMKLLFNTIFLNQNSKQVDQLMDNYHTSMNESMITAEQRLISKLRNAHLTDSTFEENSPILQVYRNLYTVLPLPKIADSFLRDDVFGRLRTAGYNPISIYRVRSKENLPFNIQDDDLPSNDTIQKAIQEERLYAHDFSFLSQVEQQRNSPKVAAVTNAIYLVPKKGDDLTTIAIHVDDHTIYPPSPKADINQLARDGSVSKWNIAKLAVNKADAIHHELVAHLGRTHLLVEPFVIATYRRLPTEHPLFVLLKPHLEGTIFINDTASKNLVAPGGEVDIIFAGEIESLMKWCAKQVLENEFNSSMPDIDIETRGVNNSMINMPYVEDALLHWEALLEWVGTYIKYYYNSDSEIVEDIELQAWNDELISENGGRVKGFGDDDTGKIKTINYLTRAVAFVIFSGSIQHAAVNFPQKTMMSFAPVIPGSLWKMPPKENENCDLTWWKNTLTPIRIAIEQVKILEVIGSVYYSRLGHYRWNELPKDNVIQTALKKYQAKLDVIDERITTREEDELLPYDYLRPKNVPQSCTI